MFLTLVGYFAASAVERGREDGEEKAEPQGVEDRQGILGWTVDDELIRLSGWQREREERERERERRERERERERGAEIQKQVA